ADEITLLCDQHHREKTNRLLPKEVVRKANTEPFNLREGVSKPYLLHFSGEEAIVEIGGNTFSCVDQGYGTAMVPISVDGTPLIGLILADGHFLLNLVIFNEYNSPVLYIKNNQLIFKPVDWDFQIVGTTITEREIHLKILFEIEFCPPNKLIFKIGRFRRNGVEILVRPTNILIANNSTIIKGCSAINCFGGLIIGHHEKPIGGFFAMDGISRYLGSNKEALKFEKESLQRSDV